MTNPQQFSFIFTNLLSITCFGLRPDHMVFYRQLNEKSYHIRSSSEDNFCFLSQSSLLSFTKGGKRLMNTEGNSQCRQCVKTYNSNFKAIHYAVRKYFSKNRTSWELLLSINHRVWVAWYVDNVYDFGTQKGYLLFFSS